ncbi:MAG: ABC transporter ATP-binding protein [candidate division KSB1 bacterium]|nr:ABC transporter ATP-binding protein [candidate division KSB1 bacterium]MDZ7273090.1 ABC transporter ATP-binding protein [candidate division KSB1 bacterium]MDZ7285193.1 ABC transporter ATP-binding protein [candidate division KSB1 bacterium]MDZ7298225.1 ABC transporter ATP-binding protein [candidate division KSB1 bacterium]MDZ7349142.1 ABC transporter ATP-binding protein [candidate division KSB1 bacterium]
MNPEPACIVETHALTKRFGNFVAVKNLDLQVRAGEIFGFLGANGAGKTTAIRMLCGLLLPTSGSGRVAGFDIFKENEQIKQRIGYMSQRFSLYEDLTPAENIEFFGGIYGLPRATLKQQRSRLLHELGLERQAGMPTRALPLGFKQRLALSCALLHDPPIVFLDEPTGGVDPEARRNFWDLIHHMAQQGKTIFVTTHYMDEAEYCHRVSIMYQGEIIALGSPQALKHRHQKASMQEVFIHLVDK